MTKNSRKGVGSKKKAAVTAAAKRGKVKGKRVCYHIAYCKGRNNVFISATLWSVPIKTHADMESTRKFLADECHVSLDDILILGLYALKGEKDPRGAKDGGNGR